MTQMTDNIIDRDALQANYINRVLDDMDIKDMMAILYDYMDVEFDKYTVDELIEQVEEYYPDLVDSWGSGTASVVLPPISCIV